MALRACLLALLASVAAVTPAQAAGAFFDRFDFASVLAQDGEDPFPAVGADGTLYLAYRDGSGNSPPGRVAIRTRSPAGAFSPDQQLVVPDPSNTGNLVPFGLGLAADGTATVLWRNNSNLSIHVRRLSPAGVLDPTITQVNSAGQVIGQSSDLAVRPSGSALVSYNNGAADRMVLREVSPGGVPGPERPLSDPGEDPEAGPQIALAPDGTAFVAWRDGNTSPERIFLRSVSPSGVVGPKLTIASGGDPGGAQVAVDAAGRVYVSWFDGRVRLRVRRADGSLGPTEDVSGTGAGGSATAVSSNGDAAFIWQQAGATTIAGRRRSAAGGYGPVVTLAGAQTGTSVQQPHLSIEAGGEAVAIWERAGAAPIVEGRGFRRSSALDPVVTLSDTSPGILGRSAIASDGLGRTMVVALNSATDKFRVQTGDFGGPEQRGLTAPPVVERGAPAVFSFTPFDAQSGIGPSRWVFSDNGATVGSSTATHTFAMAGSFTARSVSADSVGNVRDVAHPVRVADTRKPAISRFSLQRARFRLGAKPVARTAAKRRAKRSTRLRYRLSEDARVSIAVQRRTTGRRKGRSCRKATRRNRRAKRCVRYVKVSLRTLVRNQLAGKRSVVFTGRVGKRKLKAGRYRFVLQARDPSGNLSLKRTKSFRIVR